MAGDWSDFQKEFELEEIPGLVPRYNIAPSAGPGYEAPIITTQGIVFARFWYIPSFWTESLKKLPTSFNARSETAMQKGFFRGAERCLVPTSGWKEFPGPTGKKKAFQFYIPEQSAPSKPSEIPATRFFAFAGIKTEWEDRQNGRLVHSFAILTAEPSELLRDYHHRMPILVPPDHYDAFLAPQNDYKSVLAPALAYSNSAPLAVYQTSTYGNSTKVDGPSCLERAAVQTSLF